MQVPKQAQLLRSGEAEQPDGIVGNAGVDVQRHFAAAALCKNSAEGGFPADRRPTARISIATT